MDKLLFGVVAGAIVVGVVIAVAVCMVGGTTDDNEFCFESEDEYGD